MNTDQMPFMQLVQHCVFIDNLYSPQMVAEQQRKITTKLLRMQTAKTSNVAVYCYSVINVVLDPLPLILLSHFH